jgi:hypothetical protein
MKPVRGRLVRGGGAVGFFCGEEERAVSVCFVSQGMEDELLGFGFGFGKGCGMDIAFIEKGYGGVKRVTET